MAKITRTLKIVLIGSGNVATHLGKAIIKTNGFAISQVYSKTVAHVKSLGLKLGVPWTHHIHEINPGADIYILAIKDDVIRQVIYQLRHRIPPQALVVHTSGSVHSEIFKPYFKNYGVLYPLQTFSVKKKHSIRNIPFFITASGMPAATILKRLASTMSTEVKIVKDETRSVIHLSAVMVNNFPNYWYVMAEKLLRTQKISFKILLPLIEETTAKLKMMHPDEAQTGPARRQDHTVIRQQRRVLRRIFPDWMKAYDMMTLLILHNYE